MFKVCNVCIEEKEMFDFYKRKDSKDGYSNCCKMCVSEKYKKNYLDNKDKIKQHRLDNIDVYREIELEYYYNNRDVISEKKKIKYQEIKQSENERSRLYYENNKECISKRKSVYNKNNRELNNKTHKRYRHNNPHIVSWRTLLKSTLKHLNSDKSNDTFVMLGYSADDLKSHMESLFLDGMSWDNWGEWHIDHIYPLSKFDKNVLPCVVNALSNLQPLWSKDNLSKGDKII